MLKYPPFKRKIIVLPSENDIYSCLIDEWRVRAKSAINEKNSFIIAVSGGKTPIGFYKILTNSIESQLWDKTHIFIVDERFVGCEHEDSNSRMIKDIFLSNDASAEIDFHFMNCGYSDPYQTARDYEESIRSFFNIGKKDLPVFDMILLGIGEDGHTASLFPGSNNLKLRNELVGVEDRNHIKHNRITLTMPVLNNAGCVIFIVSGNKKSAVIKRVLEDESCGLPSALIKPANGELIFILDKEAASLLNDSLVL